MARAANPCELKASIVVKRPVQYCWDVYINNALVPEWAPAISAVESSSELLGRDVERRSIINMDGKPGYTVERCTFSEYLKRVDVTVIEESFGFSHMLVDYGFSMSFDAEDDNTLMVMSTQYTPKKIFASVMTRAATQAQLAGLMRETLQGFKRYVE